MEVETFDLFGNKVVAGNLVLFARRSELEAGIFIRQYKTSASVAIDQDFYQWKDKNQYTIRSFTLVKANNIFLIENPISNLNVNIIARLLEILPSLKTGKHLPKDFDENITWRLGE